MQMRYTVLFVDDNQAVLDGLQRAFRKETFQTLSTNCPKQALEMASAQPIHVVVSDEWMPQMKGLELLQRFRALYPDTVRILFTGRPSLVLSLRAINEGEIFRFLLKPVQGKQIVETVRLAFEHSETSKQERDLLDVVRKRQVAAHDLEKLYPGITQLNRNEQGSIVVSDGDDSDDSSEDSRSTESSL